MAKKTLEPETTIKDDLHIFARDSVKGSIAIAAPIILQVPGIGGALNIAIDMIWPNPATKKDQGWFINLDKKVMEHEEKFENLISDLGKKKEFVSLFYQIMPMVLKTHQEDNLEHLRNAFLNVSMGNFHVPFDFKSLLLQRLDGLTPTHIGIMKFLLKVQTERPKGQKKLLKECNSYEALFEEFDKNNPTKININYFFFLINDLKDKALVNIGDMQPLKQDKVRTYTGLAANQDTNPDSPYIVVTTAGCTMLQIIVDFPASISES